MDYFVDHQNVCVKCRCRAYDVAKWMREYDRQKSTASPLQVRILEDKITTAQNECSRRMEAN
jgi:hypothetical protein